MVFLSGGKTSLHASLAPETKPEKNSAASLPTIVPINKITMPPKYCGYIICRELLKLLKTGVKETQKFENEKDNPEIDEKIANKRQKKITNFKAKLNAIQRNFFNFFLFGAREPLFAANSPPKT